MKINGSHRHPIDSRQLLSFATVARTRSFTEAGKELSLSQSAISHAVKALEGEMGQRLLDRNGKKLQITPAGEHLLHYAEKILGDMSVARSSLDQRMRWGASRLRVGTSGPFCACVLPGILRSFLKQFPGWSVNVKTGDTRQCVDWVDQNTVDVAVVVAPSRAEAVQLTPLFTDEVMWIVAPGHPWAQPGGPAGADPGAQNFICSSAASYTSQLLEKFFERDGVRLKCVLEVGSLEAIKEMVKAGAGIAALATWNVRKELEEKSLVAVPLGKRKLKRNWCLLHSPDRKPSLAEAMFANLSLEATKALHSVAAVATVIIHFLWDAGVFELDILSV
jgi:DNA-binding transcriptional LysR family regulator